MQPYYADLLGRAQTDSNRPYQTYGNQRLADFSPDTMNAFQMMRDTAAGGTGLSDVINDASMFSDYTANTSGLTPGNVGTSTYGGLGLTPVQQVGTGTFDARGIPDMDVSAYMNPYIDSVLNNTQQRATRRFDEQQQGRDSAAIAAGAYGGSRRFVQDSLAQRDLNEQLDTINTEGLNAAFDRATELFNTDEARRLAAYEGDAGRRLNADLDNAGRGLTAAMADRDRDLQAYEGDAARRLAADTGNAERSQQGAMAAEEARRLARQLGLEGLQTRGDLARLDQDMAFRNIEGLSGVGSRIQGREQAGLDMAYADFMRQLNWPTDQLARYASILSGTPVAPSTSTTQTGPTPDFFSQLLGLGLGIGGISDILNGGS